MVLILELIAQGAQGGYLQLVHSNGSLQHRIFQIKLVGGATTFDIIGDSQQSVVPSLMNIRIDNGFIGFGTAAEAQKMNGPTM